MTSHAHWWNVMMRRWLGIDFDGYSVTNVMNGTTTTALGYSITWTMRLLRWHFFASSVNPCIK